MGLRLIYSANPQPESEAVAITEPTRLLVWTAIALFLVVKVPMLFVTNNPEELRDFDHYLRLASGQFPYRDFVWLYGPLAPIVYAPFVKLLPEALISLRTITLGFWCVGVYFVSQILLNQGVRGTAYWVGILFATGLTAYPSYSHNHILPAVALIGLIHYFIQFREKQDVKDLHRSFACLMVVFFCRPILMGVGVGALWTLLFFQSNAPKRATIAVYYALIFSLALVAFRLTYGPNLWTAFSPQPWAILETKSYPNLHYLVPHLSSGLVVFLKQIRGALETFLFYLHYFIWPTLLLTAVTLVKGRQSLSAAAIAMGFALCASLDLLHYGFSDPMSEQAMWVRGQYFFTGTALSLFLVLWPLTKQVEWRKRVCCAAVLVAISLWSYLPWIVGVSHLMKYPRNQFRYPALTAITTHGDRTAIFEAIQFVNSLCRKADTVVFPQYEPGVARLLQCQDLFALDSYIFTRMPWYPLKPRETPYAPLGGVSNGEAIQRRLNEKRPRFFVFQGKSPYETYCSQPGWQRKEFGAGTTGRSVCYLQSPS